jgi:predicted ester cyclase
VIRLRLVCEISVDPTEEARMDQAEATQVIRRLFTEVIDGRDYAKLDELVDPGYVDHGGMGVTHGHEGFTAMLEMFGAALPDFRHEVSDVTLIGDDTAIWQVHVTATFSGEMMGARGNGEPIDLWVANACRFRDGRVVEHWGLAEEGLATMLGQMGLQLPVPA